MGPNHSSVWKIEYSIEPKEFLVTSETVRRRCATHGIVICLFLYRGLTHPHPHASLLKSWENPRWPQVDEESRVCSCRPYQKIDNSKSDFLVLINFSNVLTTNMAGENKAWKNESMFIVNNIEKLGDTSSPRAQLIDSWTPSYLPCSSFTHAELRATNNPILSELWSPLVHRILCT